MAAARAEREWLTTIRAQVLRGDMASAQAVLMQALSEYPSSVELRRAQAGVFQQTGHAAEAEALLRDLLTVNAGDAQSAFALVRTLKEQGRMAAAAAVVRTCFASEPNRGNAHVAIAAIELLDDGDRRRDAAAIAEAAITSNPGDPRLHEYAGMLALQLGEFERARQHYLFALAHDPRAYEWHVPIGLAATLHYSDSAHPDFVRFREGLEHGDLSELARAELHFSLGKASDDVGRFGDAAEHFRRGNAIRRRLTKWPRKAWRRAVGSRLASRPGSTAAPVADFTPVFIVGMPRTGTTLLAELLSRYPSVCNRGELTWLGRLAQRPELNGASDPETLQRAASTYASQSRQDDAAGERWFIDKQPLNFRYIDLALALFPDAKIIHCRRGARDTALSLWMQCFLEDEQSYAYDFGDIALVLRDEERLMTHWQAQYPASIRTLRYEELVAAPRNTVVALAEWIGLSPCSSREAGIPVIPESAISTASLWQARQPIHAHSVGRWQHYARYVPELLKLPGSRLDARFPGGNG